MFPPTDPSSCLSLRKYYFGDIFWDGPNCFYSQCTEHFSKYNIFSTLAPLDMFLKVSDMVLCIAGCFTAPLESTDRMPIASTAKLWPHKMSPGITKGPLWGWRDKITHFENHCFIQHPTNTQLYLQFQDRAAFPHLRVFTALPLGPASSHPWQAAPPNWLSRLSGSLPRHGGIPLKASGYTSQVCCCFLCYHTLGLFR